MPLVSEIARFLDDFAPPALAEDWDNVGLLVGRWEQPVERVMTCLTITGSSAAEAVERKAQLIVSHHPLPFRPLTRLTDATSEGRLLLELTAARIAVFSPHTAFDSAQQGINQRLATGLGLQDIRPLVPGDDPALGSGRFGKLPRPTTLDKLAGDVKRLLGVDQLQAVGDAAREIKSVAVACGSAAEFLGAAQQAGCQVLVTGEARFHACLEAESLGTALLLAGHYASERFGVEQLADVLAAQFPDLEVWASQKEKDPLRWL